MRIFSDLFENGSLLTQPSEIKINKKLDGSENIFDSPGSSLEGLCSATHYWAGLWLQFPSGSFWALPRSPFSIIIAQSVSPGVYSAQFSRLFRWFPFLYLNWQPSSSALGKSGPLSNHGCPIIAPSQLLLRAKDVSPSPPFFFLPEIKQLQISLESIKNICVILWCKHAHMKYFISQHSISLLRLILQLYVILYSAQIVISVFFVMAGMRIYLTVDFVHSFKQQETVALEIISKSPFCEFCGV